MLRVSLVRLTARRGAQAAAPAPSVTSGGDRLFPVRWPDASARSSPTCWRRSGPDAPTCCAGWTTAHLAAHLVVRDRRPDALAGYGLEEARPRRTADGVGAPAGGPAAGLHALRRGGRPGAVGPAAVVAAGLAACRRGCSTATEFAIHHEDVRRAQPGWAPRAPAAADQDALWTAVALRPPARAGRRGLVLRRSDVPGVRSSGSAPAAGPSRASRWSCCSGPPAAGTSPA